MQHKPNTQRKLDKHQNPNVKHKPSFYVSITAVAAFTTVLCTAAFAIDGLVSTGAKILSH
jgi:hypothetical protein